MESTKRPKEGFLDRLKRATYRRLFEREMVSEDFITSIETEMNKQGVSRSDMARRMGCKPANVTRAMRTSSNLTIGTMVDMALALDQRVKVAIEPLEANMYDAEANPRWADAPKIESAQSSSEGALAGAPAWAFLYEEMSVQAGAFDELAN